MLSRVQLFCDPMNYSLQASLSIEFSRLEYWSGYNFLLQEIHPNPGIEPASSVSPALQADSLPSEPSRSICPYTCGVSPMAHLIQGSHIGFR